MVASMWTKEMVAEGEKLMQTMRAAAVAAELSVKYNLPITKNAFLGARLRAGLATPVNKHLANRRALAKNPPQKPQFRNGYGRHSTPQAPTPVIECTEPVPFPHQNRTYLPNIPSTKKCRWIHGDPAQPGAFWCGHATVLGSSWCAYHERKAYTTRPVRKQHSPVTRVHILRGRL